MRLHVVRGTLTVLQLLSIAMLLVIVLLVALARFTPVDSLPGLHAHFMGQADAVRLHDRVLVNIGYATYAGVVNKSTGLNVFKGIRFAAPPTSVLRWQIPQAPEKNNDPILDANAFGAACPHSLRASQVDRVLPSPISEDCLFLNVYASTNASGLPVLVHIHGGGYGVGDGRQDLTDLINANNNTFIGVSIQYRLGAFGFLASEEVARSGVVNAGLLDQQFALQWVQDHIEAFGGDPRKVTIFGISAGGGSVMLHNIAKDSTQGTSLFVNSISFSPYLPHQHAYTDPIPSQTYLSFVTHAGCMNTSQFTFECLISKDTATLQAASNVVSRSGEYGTWAFLPVTDGSFITSRPSEALSSGKLNGLNRLTSNVAEESFMFVSQSIDTPASLNNWIRHAFPSFNNADVASLLAHYPFQSDTRRFATAGNSGATALETSATASGYQQLANLMYAEATFVCPSYWLADAYGSEENGKGSGYKMQFSVPIALHGYDGIALFGTTSLPIYPSSLVNALQTIIGKFVRTGDPGWQPFSAPDWPMLNVNTTGGHAVSVESPLDPQVNELGAEWMVGPGLENDLSVVDGGSWEGGRYDRCGFWRKIGGKVPM